MDRQTDTSVRVKRELSDPPAGREGNDDHQSSSYRYQHAPPPRPLIVHDYDNTAAHVKKEPTSPPLRPAPITSARDDASAPRERSTGTTSERGMMDPPSSPLGPPPTRSSHDHRRSITPETFYDADDALPPPPTKLGSEYTSPPEQSGSKQPQPSSSKPGAGAPAFLTGQVPAGKGKRKQAFEARVEKKKQKQLKAVAEAVYPGPEPPLGVSRKNYLESVKEDEDIVTTMFRRVIDSDPRNVYNWISPKAQLSIKQKTKLFRKVVHPDLVILTGTERCQACQCLVDPPDLPPNWVRWPCARVLAQGPKRSCIACFRRDGGDTCKCTFAPLKGTSSAEPNPGLDYVSDNDNENEHDNDETEPGAQSRKASGANHPPKDKDKDPLSPEEAAKLRAHMAGMFGRCATLLVEYGEEIQDPNKMPTVPLEVIQTQIGKIHGSRFASLLSKGVR